MTTPTEQEIEAAAKAICKSKSCEGYKCCQWPANGARVIDCPVKRGGYNDAAIAALTAAREADPFFGRTHGGGAKASESALTATKEAEANVDWPTATRAYNNGRTKGQAEERERCARIADNYIYREDEASERARKIAAAIRAGDKK